MLKTKSCSTILKLCLRHYTSQPREIVIAAAARTPLVNSKNFALESLASQLSAQTAEAAIKQATLPKEYIDDLHLITSNPTEIPQSAIENGLVRKKVSCSSFNDSLQALQSAIDGLQNGKSNSVIMTATDTLPTKSLNFESCERFKSATLNGLYDAEIIPISLRQIQRQIITLSQDELEFGEDSTSLIATSIALTTNENASNLKIKPLLIQQLLTPMGLKAQDIHHWDMLSITEGDIIKTNLNLNSACVYANSIPAMFGQTMKSAVSLQLTHLVHTLKPKQLGVMLIPDKEGSMTAFLMENPNQFTERLPLLTLYTKDPCPLCDMLVEELELNFSNEYHLEKVFIDRKENVRYLRLYRYDIPVLFFNGQYLCMHRLNSDLLKRKLDEIKNQKFSRMVS